MMAVCICSDPQVSKQSEKNDNDTTSSSTWRFRPRPTFPPSSNNCNTPPTQCRRIDRRLLDLPIIDVISRAQKQLLSETGDTFGTFDLIISDEAHRTTGVTLKDEKESAFVRVHDNDFLRATRRIYMTATPRLYTDETKRRAEENSPVLCSMDDRSMYGDEIYRIGFGEAVKQEFALRLQGSHSCCG